MADGLSHSRTCALSTVVAQISGAHSGFPVLFTAANLPAEMFDADGSHPAQNGGGDIRFSSDSGGVSLLPCEVVSFVTDNDPAHGEAQIWVRLPNARNSQVDTIYVWWETVGTDAQPAAGAANGRNAVWPDSELVLHFEDDYADSSGNHTGTPSSAPSYVDSGTALGRAVDIANSLVFDFSSHGITHDMTVVAWLRNDGGEPWGKFGTSGKLSHWLYGGTAYSDHGRSTRQSWTPGITVSGFNHVAIRVSDTTASSVWAVHENGNATPVKTAAAEGSVGVYSSYTVGGNSYATPPMAFYRVDRVLRSADWLATEYANQNDPASFISVGTPTGVGSMVALVASTASHAQSADAAPLSQWHVLTAGDGLHGHLAGVVSLDGVASLVCANTRHAHAADMAAVTQGHVLGIAGAHHADSAAEAALAQLHRLAALAAAHAHFAGTALITLASDGAPAARTQAIAAHAGQRSIPADSRSRRPGGTNRTLSITTSR